MSKASEKSTARTMVTRCFESSRHQRSNLITAFEHVLPVIRRTFAEDPARRQAALTPDRSRRAVS
jgi:hypothetical protein